MNFATPAFQIINVTEPTDFPVTLAEVKAFSKIDADYSADDASLTTMRDAAIQALEGQTNLYFSERRCKIQFTGGACQLPYGPNGQIFSVTRNDESTPLDTDKYTIRGLQYKTIYIGSPNSFGVTSWFYPVWGGWPLPWTWTYGDCDFYTVEFNTGFPTGELPQALKQAILMLTDYFIKEQGTTCMELPSAILQIANRFSRNLVIQ